MLRQSSLFCLSFALFASPWVGVGASEWLFGRSVGMGLQFALLAALAASALALPSASAPIPHGRWLLLALAWTALGSLASWRLDSIGLFGEAPWSKSFKQLLVLVAHLGCFLAPLLLRPRGRDWSRLEWGLVLGLLLASSYGLLQALHFRLPLPGMDALDRWASSNPSIAAGSHELYLGHSFVGIPRVRAGACEPLYFGSYLLAATPLALALALRRSGWLARLALLAGVLGCVDLVLTFSRGAYLGAFVLVLLLAWSLRGAARPRPRWRIVLPCVLGALLALGFLTDGAPWELPGLLLERMGQSLQSHDMSNQTRLHAWAAAWRAFLAAPLLGIGWGDFGFHYFRLAGDGGAGAHFGWPMTNNLPLRLLAETGLVGLALWALALWPAFAAAIRPARDSRSFLFAALCIAAFIQLLTNSQLQLPHLWLLGGFSALLGQRPGPVV